MFITLLTMLLVAEGEAEAAAQKPVEQETKTDAEKADEEAMQHLAESMKKMSGENEGEETVAKPNPAAETQPEPKPEEKQPETKQGEEAGAKPNPAPEKKPETQAQTAEQAKPEEKKSDETDRLKDLEASLEFFFNKENEWNDEALEGFMKGVKNLVDEVKAIRAEQATVKEFIDDQNAQKLEAAIDEGFDTLSDDLADVFGRGTGRKIEKAFLENREKALQQVAVLKAGYEATGQEYTLSDLIRKAAMMLAPELVKTIPQQNRKREFITPPQKTEHQQAAGEDAAFEEFQRKYNELKPKE